MKAKLIKKVHKLISLIVLAKDPDLDKLGLELLEIEKKLMVYVPKKNR